MNDDFASFMEGGDDAPPSRIARGDQVEGRVVHIGRDSVYVELGTRSDGRIPREDLCGPDGELRVKKGDVVRAVVVDPDAPEGPTLAMTLGRGAALDVDALQMALDTATPVEGRVTKAVKAGLELELQGTRAFCPASQVDVTRVEDLSTFVGDTLRVLVLEVKEEGRSVIVSRRRVLEQERMQAAASAVEALVVGADVKGQVRSIQKFGAFVDVGGVEGLVHISELAHGRVERVEDAVSVGEDVMVRVLAIEEGKDGPRIKLSLKALVQDNRPPPPEKDEVLSAEVVRLIGHGVVVKTSKGEGLIPVRELSLPPGSDHRRAFDVGDKLDVALLDQQGHKLRFSVARVGEVQARNNFREYRKQQSESGGGGMGGLAAQLGKLDLGKLPEGPPPPPPEPPKPVAPTPEPAPSAAKPQPAAPALAQSPPASPSASPAPGSDAPEAPAEGGEPGKKRRRIVSGRTPK